MRDSIVALMLMFLMITPMVGALEITPYAEFPTDESWSKMSVSFVDGFWILRYNDFEHDTFWAKIINASTNETLLQLSGKIGPVEFLDGGRSVLISPEYFVRMYKLIDGSYQLQWEKYVGTYGWVSVISAHPDRDLILLGTTDVSQDNFGGHYIVGMSFDGKILFATELNVTGSVVSNIIPLGGGGYLVIVPSPLGASCYLALIDDDGNILKSERVGSSFWGGVYLQDDFVIVSWHEGDSDLVRDIRTVWGIWTKNLVPIAIVNTSYEWLGATPVFDGKSIYLFKIDNYHTKPTLKEAKYLLNGTLVWVKNITVLEPHEYSIMPSVTPVIKPFSNVYLGVYMLETTLKVIAVDFKSGILLSNVSLTVNDLGEETYFDYDHRFIRVNNHVYELNFSEIPSILVVDSNLIANVSLDGKPVGTTPVRLEVSPGIHSLKITRNDYMPVLRKIMLQPHTGYFVYANLSPLNGTVILNSVPRARVYISPIGEIVETPATLSLPNGTYSLTFFSTEHFNQYGTVRKELELEPNETLTISVTLPLLKSNLTVRANVENATVYVDGNEVGIAPLSVLVPVGIHNITVKANGYAPYSVIVNVTDVNVTLLARLEAEEMTLSKSPSPPNETFGEATTENQGGTDDAGNPVCGPGSIVLVSLVYVALKRHLNR